VSEAVQVAFTCGRCLWLCLSTVSLNIDTRLRLQGHLAMPLRLRKLWIAIGIGFVVLVVYLSLMRDPPDLGVPETLKVGHLLAYAWLMLWFAQIYRTPRRRWWLAAAFCALGVMLEYLQGMTDYRGFEYSDMVINAAGVAIGLTLAQTPLQNGLRTLETRLWAR